MRKANSSPSGHGPYFRFLFITIRWIFKEGNEDRISELGEEEEQGKK